MIREGRSSLRTRTPGKGFTGIALLLSLLTLSGCSQRVISPPAPPVADTTPPILERLYAQYQQWQKTPYLLGGESRRGVDCSSFVQQTFADQLGIPLPRTTAAQHRVGEPVRRDRLRIGDLVFFKTRVKVRHVGIYMGKQTFLHASTSQGVTLSRLDNPYWTSRYWKAKRVETLTSAQGRPH